ncbi:hypothetical protein NHX12_012679 [Muraenolepis orangiensis]|uniref:Protein FAM217B n=1 Tax=Muraenolepis orangiensis TaxID=630683 RepID=A0A9Q0DCF3_9TELE|nr:hypothetical protein NHX12_012679 [Muraenolepis orangiensis]
MGPIMQERSASTTLKRVSSKDKIKVRNAENTGLVTSSKKGNKVKKASGQLTNGLPGPGQEKDMVATIHKGMQSRGCKVKVGVTRNTSKPSSPQDEGPVKSQAPNRSLMRRKEEKREMQRLAPCCNELDQNQGRMGKNRRALSLPLSPISGLRHMPMHSPAPEALHRHYNQKEDDTDSASDLSDSERLPILPSPCTPCTPPHLNLRAEVINTSDFPGPRGAVGDVDEDDDDDDDVETPTFSYPDFLPSPFNSWSLRQLAVFLHTEGRSAPRPKPVGALEKYLERLLHLEWHQIQTVQAESSRTAGSRHRQLGFPSSTAAAAAATATVAAHPPRPYTAPPTRLNSPKGTRQGLRAPAFGSLNTPTSPASSQQQLSRYPVCPQCHIRFPLCNGSCSPYAYQRHSRLSPLMERKSRPGAHSKRSSSESRATSSDGRVAGGQGGGGGGGGSGGAQTPVSPSTAKSHVKQMQAVGNSRKPHHQEPGASGGGSQVTSGDGSQVTSGGGSQVTSGGGSQVTSGGGSQVTSGGGSGSHAASSDHVGSGGGDQAASGVGGHVASSGGSQAGGGSQVASGGQVGGGGGSQVASAGQVASARGQLKKGRVRANSETDVKKEPSSGGAKGPHVEKRIPSGGKRELSTAKKAERDWPRTETGGMATKASVKRTAKELPSLSKPLPGSKPNGKAKNVHFVAK